MSTEGRERWEERHRADDTIADPSSFVAQALDLLGGVATMSLESRRALDLACGRGRHALLLADHGYAVDAVDYALPALSTLKRASRNRGLEINCLATDVTTWPIPHARYAVVVVVNFLERTLLEALREAVAPGGALIYETHRRDEAAAPRETLRAEFLLAPGEFDDICRGWRVLARHDDTAMHEGRLLARTGVVAQRPLVSTSVAAEH